MRGTATTCTFAATTVAFPSVASAAGRSVAPPSSGGRLRRGIGGQHVDALARLEQPGRLGVGEPHRRRHQASAGQRERAVVEPGVGEFFAAANAAATAAGR